MKKISLFVFVSVFLIACSVNKAELNGDSQYEVFNPDGIPFVIADTLWDVDLKGNHRAVIKVEQQGEPVEVYLPWRRADLRVDEKIIIVEDAATGNLIEDVAIKCLNNESGVIEFTPSISGIYYVYYLPHKFRKGWDDARYYVWNDYLKLDAKPDSIYIRDENKHINQAEVLRFESRTKFDYFTPMGLVATHQEEDSIKKLYSDDLIVFAEDRAYPIRLTRKLPAKWAKKIPSAHFEGKASRNEYYVWQYGIWAAKKELKNIQIKFSDLKNGDAVINAREITCFNLEGVNWNGDSLKLNVDVPKDRLQAMWCGVQIPENAKTGLYKGAVTITADNQEAQVFDLEIGVDNRILEDKGDGDLWRHARLRWLNSTIGADNKIVPPYDSLEVCDQKIKATEKLVELAESGLPSSIKVNGEEILQMPVNLLVVTDQGVLSFDAVRSALTAKGEGQVTWESKGSASGVDYKCEALMEYDGYIHYSITLESNTDVQVKDVQLQTGYTPSTSAYFMGLGYPGGLNPQKYEWKWDGPWDSYWIGSDKAGLHVEFRGGSYHGPLLNDYKPAAPASWFNSGKGNIKLDRNNVFVNIGDTLLGSKGIKFEFALLVTPVKPVNTKKHFNERYFHAESSDFNKAAEEGANIANIHHSRKLNPVINYPFIVRDSLIAFINEQHEQDRKVKLYYTIRELSNYVQEIYALKSLNQEIFAPGVGYGTPWHMEHLIEDYRPAWYTELPDQEADAALVLSGFSRWINYYLEGLRWMFENYQIDGIYMDDVSFDRNVMKRIRRIISMYRPEAVIDLHSNTDYSKGPANQYTDFFPYLDRLWFGEHFWYDRMTPDQWFVQFSGIPFGMMSEMLQDGGNRYLGMVYGTTARHSYGQYSPAPVWKLWKDFGIDDAEMIGYWDSESPVKTTEENVKVTSFVKSNKVLLSLGNFDSKSHKIKLKIDWGKLGLDKNKVQIIAPYVEDFQEERMIKLDDNLEIQAKKGLLLEILY
ncbi:MAG: glycoside hydrolase domain-containing protein [Bacteroidales bacterium]